jgi:heme oxygenase
MSLKELTKDKHTLAETTLFMKSVFASTMPMKVWIDYTYQKQLWYQEIERSALRAGLLKNLQGIERANLITQDYKEMIDNTFIFNTYKEVTKDYVIYLKSLTDPKKILAHLYTWHMGDMFGGQMIKKIIDAPHKHLEFENAMALISVMRPMLTDDLADEANTAFDWAIKILQTYDRDLAQN